MAVTLKRGLTFTVAAVLAVALVAASCGGQGGRHRGQSVQVVNTR